MQVLQKCSLKIITSLPTPLDFCLRNEAGTAWGGGPLVPSLLPCVPRWGCRPLQRSQMYRLLYELQELCSSHSFFTSPLKKRLPEPPFIGAAR